MSANDSARPSFHRTASGLYVTEPVNPLDRSKRIRLVADSESALLKRREWVREIGRDLELGAITRAAAMVRLTTLERGRPLGVLEAWDRWTPTLAAEARAKVGSTWKHQIGPFLGDRACYDLDERELRLWVRSLDDAGYAPKTIHASYWLLHAAIAMAVKSHLLDALPWGDWRPPQGEVRKPRAVARSIDDLVAIANVAFAHDAALWQRGRLGDLAFRVLLVFYVGLRQGEAAALGWDHWHASSRQLEVRLQAKDGWRRFHPEWVRPLAATKGRKEHVVPVHDVVAHVLELQRAQLARLGIWRADGPIFPANDGGAWRSNAVCIKPENFKALALRAGVANVEAWCPHSLRHSKATLEHSFGVDVRGVQLMLAHSDEKTTRLYIHAGPQVPASRLPSLALPDLVSEAGAEAARRRLEEADTQPAPAPAATPPSEDADDGGGGELGMFDLARLALARGDERRPKAIADGAERAYVRHYCRAQRAGEGLAKARAEGRAARARYLGTWEAARKRVAKEGA